MIFEGPFQHKQFYDSMKLAYLGEKCSSILVSQIGSGICLVIYCVITSGIWHLTKYNRSINKKVYNVYSECGCIRLCK